MAKFGNIFGSGSIVITQTYHGENPNNRRDFSRQVAVDFSRGGGSPFVAVSDGRVEVVKDAGANSYISVIPSGANFRILYVHTHRWTVRAGQNVKKGQRLGFVYPMAGSHIHFGLRNLSGTAPHPQPMDYFDRRLNFTAGFPVGSREHREILAAWFVNGKLNWNLFKNLRYNQGGGNTMNIGDKIEIGINTIMRQGHGVNAPYKTAPKGGALVVQKGAVGTIIGGPRYANNLTWWDTRFPDNQGWMADVNSTMRVSTKAVTPTSGPVPTPAPKPTPKPKPAPKPTPAPTPPPTDWEKKYKETLKKLKETESALSSCKSVVKNQLIEIKDLQRTQESHSSHRKYLYDQLQKMKLKNQEVGDKLTDTLNKITITELLRHRWGRNRGIVRD